MEKAKTERIKEYALAGFVLISVIMIALLWSNNLLDRESDGPSFYRATIQADSGFYLTRTAEATSGIVPPTREHKNEHSTSTPAVLGAMTPALIQSTPTIEVDQEN